MEARFGHTCPSRDRAPWHWQPPRQSWLGDPAHLQVLLQQRLPVSPMQPGRMDPFGEATGNMLQLRNYWCKRSPKSQRALEKRC